jgi:predicted secreted protein
LKQEAQNRDGQDVRNALDRQVRGRDVVASADFADHFATVASAHAKNVSSNAVSVRIATRSAAGANTALASTT